MTKVTAGLLTGLVLGAAYGAVNAWNGPHATVDVFPTLLGRASQGIVNGVLAAWAMRGRRSIWLGALYGALIGLGLGGLVGLSSDDWATALPYGAAIGLGCGVAVARPQK
jgi:hypothetical protein